MELVASQVDLWNSVDGIVEVLDLAGCKRHNLAASFLCTYPALAEVDHHFDRAMVAF